MKVFINKRVGSYSGGMVIVAANNVEEANILLLQSFPEMTCMVDINGYPCYIDNECAEVSHYHYKKENWLELPNVTADYTIPTFIAEDGYSE